jgi:hypothetical protein
MQSPRAVMAKSFERKSMIDPPPQLSRNPSSHQDYQLRSIRTINEKRHDSLTKSSRPNNKALMTLYKSNIKSDENSSQEDDEVMSPRVSIGKDRFKKKRKMFKPIYGYLGLEPLVVEDMLGNKHMQNEKLKNLDPLARAVLGWDDDEGNALNLP